MAEWKWYEQQPWVVPMSVTAPVPVAPAITPEEIAEFRKLLERAREYDKKHQQSDCDR